MAHESVTGRGRLAAPGIASSILLSLAAAPPPASAAVLTCLGDANGDGIVTFDDITSVLANWLNDYTPGSGPGDANGDGIVTFDDITAVLANWLDVCIVSLRIDEPGTWHEPPASPLVGPEHGGGHALHRALDYCTTGVYPATGEFHCEAVDLAIPGRGLHFVHARKYRSRAFPRVNAPGAIVSVMGNGWTHSYDIQVADGGGGNLLLSDGNSRTDLYEFDPALNAWINAELFRTMHRETDLSFVTRFAHGGVWRLNALDGSPTAGKINAIEDRNGNRVTFQYDALGRLVSVTDALDSPGSPRQVVFAYNPDGLLESVTDWAGRSVQYAYYNDGDLGGSFGDLKSVTSPAVVPTPEFRIPPGHEYPLGKTTVYTYSTGFGDERLNHNLLTITDPKGQTYLTNIYFPTSDQTLVEFDRVERQVYGGPTDVIDFVPKVRLEIAVSTEVVINDRMGNVEHWTYDDRNRPTKVEEFTGRADPNLPTDLTTNRPTAPLRSTDPASFVAAHAWNDNSLPVSTTRPAGNSVRYVYEADLNPLASPRSAGNLRERHLLPGSLGGDQAQITELLVYDPLTNYPVQHTDGRGNVTTFVRDPAGNATQIIHRIPSIVDDYRFNSFGQMTLHIWPDNGSGHRREDAFLYYDPTTPQHGYLQERAIDATGLKLKTTSGYDSVGNEIRFTDTKGKEELYIHSQLNQCVLVQSRELTLGSPPALVRYETEIFYDLNDMPVRIDLLNLDDTGQLIAGNTHITSIYEHVELNFTGAIWQEKADVAVPRLPPKLDTAGLNPADFVRTEFVYDANRNVELIRFGEATNGNDPNNVVQRLYDERDLLFQATRGLGSPDQSTTQTDYDANGNVLRVTRGLEGATPRVSGGTYDGFDRLTSLVDPMGNVRQNHYDANGNMVRRLRLGAVAADVPGSAGNVRLREVASGYDALDRLTSVTHQFFDPLTQLPLDDGASQRTIRWSDASQVVQSTDDNGNSMLHSYDTALRLDTVTDALGNALSLTYDTNSNVLQVTESEVNLTLPPASPPEVFQTLTMTYDALDRLTSRTDGTGNGLALGWDSRGNLVRIFDENGIESLVIVDNLSRPLFLLRDMDANGASLTNALDLRIGLEFDDSHRPTRRVDPNGNETRSIYDSLNRETQSIHADTTLHLSTFDVFDNRIAHIDANGSTEACTYDLLDRLTRRDIVVAPGVSSETTFETCQWDGLGRLLRAEDDDSLIARTYDSLDNMMTESFDARTYRYTHDGVGDQVAVLYPSGVSLTRTFDPLNRVSQIFDSGFLASTFTYAGPSRVARRSLFNNTVTNYTFDGITGVPNPPGDLGFKQLIATSHRNTLSGVDVDSRSYSWDPAQNKLQRRDVRIGGPGLTHDLSYDDAYRLTGVDVTDPAAIPIRSTLFGIDPAGNRTEIVERLVSFPYVMDPTLPNPADEQANQYTDTPEDSRSYDENGNLLSRSLPDLTTNTHTFNYHDRLVEVVIPATGTTATYRYDALGRRIAKVVTSDLGVREQQFTYLEDEQCDGLDDDCDGIAEEFDGLGAVRVGWIRAHGRPLFMNRDGQIRAYHFDDMGSAMAMTDNGGNVQERYEYGDFGAASITDALGVPRPASTPENPFLFHGHYLDPETGFYLAGARHLDPMAGRFITRDPGGMWCDEGALGNAFTYAGNNPWSFLDPSGRAMAHSGARNEDKKSTPKDEPKLIPVLPWYDLPGSGGHKSVSGDGSGKASIKDLSLTKETDKPSAGLMLKCCDGKHHPKAVLTVRKATSHFNKRVELDVRIPMVSGYGSSNAPGGGGANHSIWIDPGFPLQRSADGRRYKPLFAPLILDMDGRYNVNTQGGYRPPRVTSKPTVIGPQTAKVEGPAGEEIWTDTYGRVKVHFHWDRSQDDCIQESTLRFMDYLSQLEPFEFEHSDDGARLRYTRPDPRSPGARWENPLFEPSTIRNPILRDFNFEKPRTSFDPRPERVVEPRYEQFDYPGAYRP